LTIAYILLKNVNSWLGFSTLLSEHFSGKNYQYFFLYFIDVYFWSFVLLYLPYLKYFELDFNNQNKIDIQSIIQSDKYIAVLSWLFNFIINKPSEYYKATKQQLQSPLKTGWLLLAVKFFFLPLLASWVIGNVIHQWNLLQNFDWTFRQINTFILALLILTDTSIFLVGYMFENSQLGSKVRSVEPTILGWLVCLWCYPPFNLFSFAPFDINLINIHYPIATWAEPIVLILITLLWAIFTWASVNLGFKASNLTNRGIVKSGVYAYCRHPAYTAKIAVWLVEAIFLGKYFIGLFIAFFIIYLLRAITEERHLSIDPDYLEYKEQVPYRFIPGFI
jgi:protein-S-isoprenylcysteine O-methyltransferase Ste14